MAIRPLRVMHVLGSLSVGGVETWLAQMVGQLDPARVESHFFLHSKEPGVYAPALCDAGCRIVTAGGHRNPLQYRSAFRAALHQLGPIDVVHSHVHHFSGLVLMLAAQAGVPKRIAHSHSNTALGDGTAGLLRRAYLRTMEGCVRRYATHGLAASEPAADALFGPRWREDPRFAVQHCGIDLSRFRRDFDRDRIRAGLGVGPEELVVGHVGRFAEPKNHAFMVEIAREVHRLEPRARFLWVGDGPLRPEITKCVARAGLAHRAILPGLRMDVPEVLSAMDVFLFPSLWEGMPLGLVEAQASGLPCVVSDSIAAESLVVRQVRRMSLRAPAGEWAKAVASASRADRWSHRFEALEMLEKSTFNLTAATRALEDIYLAA